MSCVNVPVNADFEGGFADDPARVGANVKLAAATGIAGLSIEDSTRDGAQPLYEFDHAVERIRAARQAIDESGTGVVLTVGPKVLFAVIPTSTTPSEGCAPAPTPAPTVSTHRESTPSSRSQRSLRQCRPNRSVSSSTPRLSPSQKRHPSVCAESVSEARSHEPHGPDSWTLPVR